MYTVPVTIEGKQYTFLLATGAKHSIINKDIVKKLKISSSVENNNESSITVPKIAIAGNVIHSVKLQLVELSPQTPQFSGFRIDGFLAMDIYNQFVWDVDNYNKKIYIHPVSDTTSKENYKQCINYQLDTVPVLINSITKDGHPISFFLNTGVDMSSINSQLINPLNLVKVNINDNVKSITNNTVRDNSHYYCLENFKFDNIPVGRSMFDTSTTSYNYLALDFLSRFDQFQLNPVDKTLCFDNFNNRNNVHFHAIGLKANNGNIEVFNMSKADSKRMNLQNGDIIISINHKKYPPDQITALRSVISYTRTLDLDIVRNGKIMHIFIN